MIEANEGPGNLPLDRKMITPRDLATTKELTRVFPVEEVRNQIPSDHR